VYDNPGRNWPPTAVIFQMRSKLGMTLGDLHPLRQLLDAIVEAMA
jgi:hypothetical protein